MTSPGPRQHLIIRVLVAMFALLAGALDISQPASAWQPNQAGTVYLPIVYSKHPWPSAFGVEVSRVLGSTLEQRAADLGTRWVRLHRVSWREIQPDEGGPYDWSVLASFEDELTALRRLGMTPVVIVHHSPRWATIVIEREPPLPPLETDCAAIRADRFDAFADFMAALVARYSVSEFNVHHWELGNEPDVDPTLVGVDKQFGCWGDIDDPYYGGAHYGEMLKAVTPAIKAADPTAQVLVGGLLLATPETTDPGYGRPELFLQGILEAGAAPYFDILPFHAYGLYGGAEVDYDNQQPGDPWTTLGGRTLGKALYLRGLMEDYGVQKPLHVNEMALGCNPDWQICDPPPPEFYEAQADFLVRTMVRGLSTDLQALIWYSLDGPAWRNTGLLEGDSSPRPAYRAYRNLSTRLSGGLFSQALEDYGLAIEAYAFTTSNRRVHIVWSIDMTPDEILVPQSQFLAAYDREGATIEPVPVGDDFRLMAGFSPIFVDLRR